jgi:hypothetical protein
MGGADTFPGESLFVRGHDPCTRKTYEADVGLSKGMILGQARR